MGQGEPGQRLSVSPRRPCSARPPDRVPGDDSEQSPGAAQVQESAALQRQERRALRGHQPYHPPRQVGPRGLVPGGPEGTVLGAAPRALWSQTLHAVSVTAVVSLPPDGCPASLGHPARPAAPRATWECGMCTCVLWALLGRGCGGKVCGGGMGRGGGGGAPAALPSCSASAGCSCLSSAVHGVGHR